jgi:protein O-GlcNAc transferase
VGHLPAGRAGWSQLNNLALQRLAASSPEEFVQSLASLSDNPHELASLRRSLRARMKNSPLMDGARFARDMESAYFTMWRASVSA